jgi:ribonuclease T2
MSGWLRRILLLLAVVVLLALRAWLPSSGNHPSTRHPDPGQPRPQASQKPATGTGEAVRPASNRSNSEIASGDGFDFYVLSLSWSPSYCAAEGGKADRQQCAAARPYAFIVHGLWPQNERSYPRDCPANHQQVDFKIARGLSDIMPSVGLIRHEWKTHGACTGLDQADYFRILRAARDKVSVPAQYRQTDRYRQVAPGEVEAAFLRANRRLPANGVSVTCDRRFLREVRICLTKDLDFRSCPQVDKQSCRRSKVVMPPVRGG